jgi:TackOD1 domain-containing protein/restriction endonuclease
VIATSPPGRSDSSAITSKIAEIRENKISRYEPIVKPEGGLTYTGFSDHDFARQVDILKTLQVLGIVREEPFDYIRKCSRCDHHGMLVKVACPACGSTNTDQGKVIEHLPCGNIDLESRFQTAEGGLVCPKCKKKLKAIGVDYVKPGSYCSCLSCKTLSPEGKMQFICLNCGSSLAKEEMKLEPLAAYTVDQEAVAKYLDKTGFQFHLSVVDALRSRGVKAAPRAAVIGSSQVQHTFDIVAYVGDEPEPAVAVEIEKSSEPVDPESLLNFLARCLDAKVGRKVFIGIPGFSEEARKLAGAHGIEIIESSGSDVQEIAEKISTGMPQEQVSDGQLEEMIDSMREAVEEEDVPKPEQPDTESKSLEKMLRTIISRPKDDEGQQGS